MSVIYSKGTSIKVLLNEEDGFEYVYVIKSKSLPDALSRTLLMVEVMGDRAVQIEHVPPHPGKKKHKVFVSVT